MESIPPRLVGVIVFLIVFALMLAFYFLPAIIAFYSKHPKRWSIFWLTLFFGWSIIGWFLLLVWACRPGTRSVTIAGPPTIEVNESNVVIYTK